MDKYLFIIQQRAHMSEDYQWTEQGLAHLFKHLYSEEVRYSIDEPQWLVYQDGKWTPDPNEVMVGKKIQEFYDLMDYYARQNVQEENYSKFIAKLGATHTQESIKKSARIKLGMRASDFDNCPNLINCANGTYDTETCTFREHRWEDFLTMQTNFKYQQGAERFERWEQFINEVTENDIDKADFLQRALAYSMLGRCSEDCMFILHGKTTRNGKSTMLDAIMHLLGDYATVLDVNAICKSDFTANAEAPSPMVADLKGKRFVTMAESDSGGRLDEAIIKKYTGGEEITARPLFKKSIKFKPQFVMWLSCNDLPRVRDKSLFSSERLRVVEFNRHFTASERDKSLKELFRTDEAMSGIFSWLLDGLEKYKVTGLSMCESMQKVIDEYEKDNDLVLQFLEERCEQTDDGSTTASALYSAYKMWAKSNSFHIMSSNKFGRELSKHEGWYSGKIRSNGVRYQGLLLKQIITLD